MEKYKINMFGEFSIQHNDILISDKNSRQKKVWMLIAYLFCQKDRIVTRQEIIGALWGDDPSISNPENTLKIVFHRARTLLDELWENAGHQLILHTGNGYKWNTDITHQSDIELFESYCRFEHDDKDEYIEKCIAGLELYKGEFLCNISSLPWVIPMAAYFSNLYTDTVLSLCPALSESKRYSDIINICYNAISREPYHEGLYQELMQAFIDSGQNQKAVEVYETLAKKLDKDFGIKPNDDSKNIYLKASSNSDGSERSIDAVMGDIHESEAPEGALECEYEFFRILCFAEARSMQRSGKESHVGILSVASYDEGKKLKGRILDRAMDLLGKEIASNLRKGDSFTKCSASQYIMLLPTANYENSCMVCRRVIGSFQNRNPHSPAEIIFMVKPLTPKGLM